MSTEPTLVTHGALILHVVVIVVVEFVLVEKLGTSLFRCGRHMHCAKTKRAGKAGNGEGRIGHMQVAYYMSKYIQICGSNLHRCMKRCVCGWNIYRRNVDTHEWSILILATASRLGSVAP